ncbi:hypothetical protein RJT34_14417 [Clitoria ternatea]|uniref:Uncharacterized protein n=1 Tax=Clitoria ternatea TaxID=43366 RepID=A0AAN9JQC4_CLITE
MQDRNNDHRVILSPQHLWNAVSKEDLDKGLPISAIFNWIFENGCTIEDVCPYVGVKGPCTHGILRPEDIFRIDYHFRVSIEDIKTQVREQPVAAEIHFTDEFLNLKQVSSEVTCIGLKQKLVSVSG